MRPSVRPAMTTRHRRERAAKVRDVCPASAICPRRAKTGAAGQTARGGEARGRGALRAAAIRAAGAVSMPSFGDQREVAIDRVVDAADIGGAVVEKARAFARIGQADDSAAATEPARSARCAAGPGNRGRDPRFLAAIAFAHAGILAQPAHAAKLAARKDRRLHPRADCPRAAAPTRD